MKIKDLLNIKDSIYNLGNLLLPEPYTKYNYEVYKIIKIVESELENFGTQQYKIAKKYGTENEDGNYIIDKTNENYEQCCKELNELTEIEVDIPIGNIIINPSVISLKPLDIYNLIEHEIIKEETK
jgi:hypothetical protein